MILRFFGVLFCLFMPVQAQAQSLVVRSGEHGEFTRIAIDMPEQSLWSFREEATGFSVTVGNAETRFNLDAAFEKIGTDRITSLSSTGNTLTAQFECDCAARAFLATRKMLVVDVKQRSPVKPEIRPKDPENTVKLPLTLSKQETMIAVRPVVPVIARSDENLEQRNHIFEAEQRLLQQLGRAASQGLLTPETQIRSSPKPSPPEGAAKATPDGSTQKVQLKAETSMDEAFTATHPIRAHTNDGDACLDNSWIDVPTWANEDGFGPQMARLRDKLYDERDRVDPAKARALARLYIYFGFGAEAAQTAHLLEPGRDADLLLALAKIVDGEAIKDEDNPFDTQIECESDVSLWALLANRRFNPQPSIANKAVLRSFSALPTGLQTNLGPKLASQFLQAKLEDDAAAVLRIVNRTETSASDEHKLVSAEVDLMAGHAQDAAQALEEVATGGGELSPEALVKMIRTSLQTGLQISTETSDLASAYAYEFRKTPIGQELREVQILAAADAGQFETAFEFVSKLERDDKASAILLREQVFRILTNKGPDIAFLKFAAMHQSDVPDTLSPMVGNSVARRLIATRFLTLADAYLRPSASGAAGRERNLLRMAVVPDPNVGPIPEAAPPIPQDTSRQDTQSNLAQNLPPLEQGRKLLETSEQARAEILSQLAQTLLSEAPAR